MTYKARAIITWNTLILCATIMLSVTWKATAQWGFTIGQKEIPEVVIQKDLSEFKVYPGHPRLFFRDTDIPTIKERINHEFRQEWDKMVHELDSGAMIKPASHFAQGKYLKAWDTGRNVTFMAVITGADRYIDWARQWAKALAAAGPVGNDNEFRGRLQSLAVAYDWLYSWLSDAERELLQEAIAAHIERNWYFSEKVNYAGGHSRWGNFALTAGILSIVTEKPEFYGKLMTVRDHWLNGFHPLQGWIAGEGGYHMGWAYSVAYLSGANHCVWSSATNECVYYSWQSLLPLFWIYGRQGDGLYPNTGDAYTIEKDLNSSRESLMIAAGILKNPYAAWTIKESSNSFADILYGDKNVQALSPDNTDSPLPLSCNFQNAGVVIARDRWDEETTHLQFRSVPFYSSNHHHRDENSFTIHYKGPLAIDSGLYDEGGPGGGYGRSHWRNYFTRTIAHNAITVFDPDQKMDVYGTPASNDGGQTYRTEPGELKDILPGGHASFDGIIHYQDTKEYTYIVGDATKAYDAQRVKLAQREIIYLRQTHGKHPVIIVFDRVKSARPELKKSFLLHMVNEPEIKDKTTIIENKGGRLTCLTLFPEDAGLQLIGGTEKEFQVNGTNYPTDRNAWDHPGIEPGNWRLEVSPGKKQTEDYFLHVLFVDDTEATPVNIQEAKLIKKSNSVGVKVAGWKVIFSFHLAGKAQITPFHD